MQNLLLEPYKLHDFQLQNRIVMAPLTRRRAENPDLSAGEMTALYYAQRSSTGLLISEGSQISPEAYGYTHSPGCYTDRQIAGWEKVTNAVHKKGGTIFLQLWHVGPFSHPLLQPGNRPPLASSEIKPSGEVLTPEGHKPYETARAMTKEDIFRTVNDFGKAARNAMAAGFDGVEIHGAHAYIIDQFIMDGTNKRTDEFGVSVENRSKLLFMVVEEVLKRLPKERVGLRLSPRAVRPGMEDSNPENTYGFIIKRLNDYQLCYLHLSEMLTPEERLKHPEKSFIPFYREIYNGVLISCGGHTLESANSMLAKNEADLIAFGKPMISNPDLAKRFRTGAPLAEPDKETFYHGGAKGYVDYPFV
jgi:N-ethylmaleimide reductase